jgi:hypothetical protein
MLGDKTRSFGPLPSVTLEDLVLLDHFYRYVERSIDLSFVRLLVHEGNANSGRPSIDPVVFFNLQLILFFSLKACDPSASSCGWSLTDSAYAGT